MSSSSLSIAAAAIGNCLHSSVSSTWLDHNLCFKIFPNKPKPILKLAPSKFHTGLQCVPTAAFDSIELNQEDEEEAKIEETVVEEAEEEENDVAQSMEAGRLYVGNLPFSMTSSQLSEIFAEAGRVVSVEIVYDRVTDRSRGFAFVTMGSAEEAKEAIRLFDGAQIGGRSAKVNFPEVPKGGEREVMSSKIRSSYQGFVDSPHKIYAGNLSWSVTSQNLREAFEQQPGYLSAKVIYDRDSGRSRGFGFITFTSAEDVESALSTMNGVEFEGRPLRLNMAEQRAPMSSPITAVQNNTSASDLEDNEMI